MNQATCVIIIFRFLGIAVIINAINILRDLDKYWETYLRQQKRKGFNPESFQRSSDWDNSIIIREIVSIVLGILVLFLPSLLIK